MFYLESRFGLNFSGFEDSLKDSFHRNLRELWIENILKGGVDIDDDVRAMLPIKNEKFSVYNKAVRHNERMSDLRRMTTTIHAQQHHSKKSVFKMFKKNKGNYRM